jgi:uncharacterized alpha-E superfamily protein
MLSRVAESVYWMSRYVERAENVARFVNVNYNLTLGNSSPLGEQWSPLVYTTGDHQDFEDRYDGPTRENVLRFLLFDRENPNSIYSCISHAREAARTVREVLPSGIWEQLNRFYLLVKNASGSDEPIQQPYDFCDSIRMASNLLVGIQDSSMLHDEAWSFVRAGRFIERADKTSRIVDVQYFLLLPKARDVGSSIDVIRWSSLLKSADALNMYRRTYGRLAPEKVAQFLILDPIFPRSIRFCVSEVAECLQQTARLEQSIGDSPSGRLVGQLLGRLEQITIEEIIEQGMHAFIDHVQGALNLVGSAVQNDYFNSQAANLQAFGKTQVAEISGQVQA